MNWIELGELWVDLYPATKVSDNQVLTNTNFDTKIYVGKAGQSHLVKTMT